MRTSFRTLGGAFYLAVCCGVPSTVCTGAEIIGGPVVNPADGHVYYLLSQSDWHTAETQAVRLGGHLLTINDQAEQDFVWQNFVRVYGVNAQRSFWIGLNDIAMEGTFVWSSGEPVSYTHWRNGEPNDAGGTEDAVQLIPAGSSADSLWNDNTASRSTDSPDGQGPPLHGIVELVPTPPKWVQWPVNGHYYALTTIARTNWFNAEAEAATHAGGHLISINSAEEQAFIEATFLAGNSRSNIYWIGLNDVVSEGTWVWSSGESLTYTNWAPLEPNNAPPGEDAVVLNWYYGLPHQGEVGQPGQWNDWFAAEPPANVHWIYGIMEVPSLVQHFTRIATGDAVSDKSTATGVAWIDYDEDGYLDLFVSSYDAPNALYRNDGRGSLVRHSIDGLTTEIIGSLGAQWADYDNNGLLDVFVANLNENQPNYLYRGTGGDVFTRIAQWPFDDATRSVTGAWGDFDDDGNLDLFVANSLQGQYNYLYRNLGNGTFSKVIQGSIVTEDTRSPCATWGDYDDDGDLDLFASSEGAANRLYRNEGNGNFTKITSGPVVTDGGGSRGCAWGDYNNDGFLDLFVASMAQNYLYRNNGNGTFSRVTSGPVVTDNAMSVGCAWGDYDNDGWLDLFVANESGNDALYRNEQGLTFVKVTDSPIVNDATSSFGCAWGDYNGDGSLDLYVSTGFGKPGLLYRNDGNTNNWLAVRCIGTRSNRSGIGAKVRVRTGEAMWQLREISGGTGYGSQDGLVAHFGLGQAPIVDALRIEWPSGIVHEFHDVAVNRLLTISEPPTLEAIGMTADKGFEMTLTSRGGFSYEIEHTATFETWGRALRSTDVNGSVQVVAPGAATRPWAFYQAVEIPRSGSGLTAWWAGEANGFDRQGQFHAIPGGTVNYKPGVFGEAFSFDHSGGWLRTSAPVLTKVDDWTMELWAYLRGSRGPTQPYQFLLYSGLGGLNGYGMYIVGPAGCATEPWYCGKEGMLVILYGGRQYVPSYFFPPENTWVHLAITRSAGLLQLYADGRHVFAAQTSDPAVPTDTTWISGEGLSSLNGLIDEARVWNRALSGAEVRDIHRVGALRLALPR